MLLSQFIFIRHESPLGHNDFGSAHGRLFPGHGGFVTNREQQRLSGIVFAAKKELLRLSKPRINLRFHEFIFFF
jgi:hypothetical protein